MCLCKTRGILAKTFSSRKDAWSATCWPRRTLAHRGAGRKRSKAHQQMTLRDGGGVKFPPGDCCNPSIMDLSIISNGGFKTGPGEYDATDRTRPLKPLEFLVQTVVYPRRCLARSASGTPTNARRASPVRLNGRVCEPREAKRASEAPYDSGEVPVHPRACWERMLAP